MVLAARGSRGLDGGVEPIDDAALVRRLRARAAALHAVAFGLALLATALACWLPIS